MTSQGAARRTHRSVTLSREQSPGNLAAMSPLVMEVSCAPVSLRPPSGGCGPAPGASAARGLAGHVSTARTLTTPAPARRGPRRGVPAARAPAPRAPARRPPTYPSPRRRHARPQP